jgi:hypothetical protein
LNTQAFGTRYQFLIAQPPYVSAQRNINNTQSSLSVHLSSTNYIHPVASRAFPIQRGISILKPDGPSLAQLKIAFFPPRKMRISKFELFRY